VFVCLQAGEQVGLSGEGHRKWDPAPEGGVNGPRA
jgi:hypothetical protein